MRIFIFFIALFSSLLIGNAKAAERQYAIGSFENVQIEGDLIVNITTQKAPSAIVRGSNRQLDNIRFERNDRTLKIILNRSNDVKRTQDQREAPLEISISTSRLTNITIRGNGSVFVNTVQSKTSKFLILGAGMINLADADINNLKIEILGNGNVKLQNGQIRKSNFIINGNGAIEASNISSKTLSLIHQGSGNTIINVSEVANINNNGTGRIEILGSANCIIKSIGSGQILCNESK